MAQKKEEQLNLWIGQLSDASETVFKKALDGLSESGNISIMRPVAEVMFKEENRLRKHLMAEFFANIEQPDAKEAMVDIILEEKNTNHQIELLNVIWNSRMDFSEFLLDFIELAIDGPFEVAMECHTIIENMDGPFDETDVLEGQLLIGSYEKHPSRSKEKDFLIGDIAGFLSRIDSELSA